MKMKYNSIVSFLLKVRKFYKFNSRKISILVVRMIIIRVVSTLEVTSKFTLFKMENAIANNFNIHDSLDEVDQEIVNDPIELHALLGDNFLGLTNTSCPSSPLNWNAIADKTIIDINAMEEGHKNLQRCINTYNENAQSIISELNAITARKENALQILAEITKDEESITARKENALQILAEISKEQVLMITKKDEALSILDNEKAKLLSIEQDILKNKATVAKIRLEAEQEAQRKKEISEREVIRQREIRESREKSIQEATEVVNDLVQRKILSLDDEEEEVTDDEAIKERVAEEDEEMEIENEVTMESSLTSEEQSFNDFKAWSKQFTTAQKLFIIQSYGKGLLV